jgi:hypothetical protein
MAGTKLRINELGLEDTASLIRKNSMFIVKFAELAVQGKNIQ